MRRVVGCVVACCAFAVAGGAAAQYRSIADNGVVMYDGPSTRATRVAVATRNLPVEVISTDGTWVKVRDPSGDLLWVERKALSDRRTVLVTVPVLDIRPRPEETAPAVLQVAQGVVLEYGDQTGVTPGWVRVRHRDGASGFVRISQVWGL
jgi:SH3-like domain-containing protein